MHTLSNMTTKEQASKSEMGTRDLQPQSVAPTDKHTHTVIFLHGRDSSASEFASDLFESQASDNRTLPEIFPSFKWVFPASGTRHSARFGVDMNQWFDMWSTEEPSEREEMQKEGIEKSMAMLEGVIAEEGAELGFDRIILGGISQGCAVAIYTLLSGEARFGGFIGLCSWLPLKEKIVEKVSHKRPGSTALKTPIFLSHSRDDEVVPIWNGKQLYQELKNLAICSNITWKEYDEGGHWVHEPQGIDDMVEFIQNIVAETAESS